VLTREQVVDLSVRLRDESQRLEIEWRAEFEAAFGGRALPPSQDAEIVVQGLLGMIESTHHGAAPALSGSRGSLESLPSPSPSSSLQSFVFL